MSHLTDLARDSKLETRFHGKYTRHRFQESDVRQGERSVVREEYWKREKFVGGGAYGRVWYERCVKGEKDHNVRAVKEITKPQSSSKAIDYTRELEAIAKFSHERYVRCFVKSYGWYEDEQSLYITMEYMPHGDLHKYMSVSPPLQEADSRIVVYQLLEGLGFLHDNGFAHRDVKPSNVLIKAKPPDPWWVKICDFGISKRAGDITGNSSTLKGTLGYMPPELHGFLSSEDCFREHSHSAFCAADTWSLGEITFQLLTGEASFPKMGTLAAYVRDPSLFPRATLQRWSVSQCWSGPSASLDGDLQSAEFQSIIDHIFQSPDAAQYPEPSGTWSTIAIDTRPPQDTEHNLLTASRSGAVQTSKLFDPSAVMVEVDKVGAGATNSNISIVTAIKREAMSPSYKRSRSESGTPPNHLETKTKNVELTPHDSDITVASLAHAVERKPVNSIIPDGANKSITISTAHRSTGSKFDHPWHQLPWESSDYRVNENNAVTEPYKVEAGATDTPTDDQDKQNMPTLREFVDEQFSSTNIRESLAARLANAPFTVSTDGSGRVLDADGYLAGHVGGERRVKLMGEYVEPIVVRGHIVGFTELRKRVDSDLASSSQNLVAVSEPDEDMHPSQPSQPSSTNTVIRLYEGNLVLDLPQTEEFLENIPHAPKPQRDEFTHWRYTAVSCRPESFVSERYTLRPRLFLKPRSTEILVAIHIDVWPPMEAFATFMDTAFDAILSLHAAKDYPNFVYPQDSWKSVMLAFVGPTPQDPDIVKLLAMYGIDIKWYCPPDGPVSVNYTDGYSNARGIFGYENNDSVKGTSVKADIYEVKSTYYDAWINEY